MSTKVSSCATASLMAALSELASSVAGPEDYDTTDQPDLQVLAIKAENTDLAV
jgi:hypothetical protein